MIDRKKANRISFAVILILLLAVVLMVVSCDDASDEDTQTEVTGDVQPTGSDSALPEQDPVDTTISDNNTTEPSADTEPHSDPVSEPASDPVSEPVTDPVTEPVTTDAHTTAKSPETTAKQQSVSTTQVAVTTNNTPTPKPKKKGALPAAPYTPYDDVKFGPGEEDLYDIRESVLAYDWITPEILPRYYRQVRSPSPLDYTIVVFLKDKVNWGYVRIKNVKLTLTDSKTGKFVGYIYTNSSGAGMMTIRCPDMGFRFDVKVELPDNCGYYLFDDDFHIAWDGSMRIAGSDKITGMSNTYDLYVIKNGTYLDTTFEIRYADTKELVESGNFLYSATNYEIDQTGTISAHILRDGMEECVANSKYCPGNHMFLPIVSSQIVDDTKIICYVERERDIDVKFYVRDSETGDPIKDINVIWNQQIIQTDENGYACFPATYYTYPNLARTKEYCCNDDNNVYQNAYGNPDASGTTNITMVKKAS